jgi:peptide-methionine (R)-S-oxide reductase
MASADAPQLSRRNLIAAIAASTVLTPLLAACGGGEAEAKAKGKAFPVSFSEAEWRKRLTTDQFNVLRQHATERPFSSPLDKEKRRGTYLCAADGNPLFASAYKYDSGTGWPSFTRPMSGAIGTSRDTKLGYPRTEVHCAQCGGHLGHVFDDGPLPTGMRYCMNGDAMTFKPA